MQRETSQRRAICRVFSETGRPLSPHEVLTDARWESFDPHGGYAGELPTDVSGGPNTCKSGEKVASAMSKPADG